MNAGSNRRLPRSAREVQQQITHHNSAEAAGCSQRIAGSTGKRNRHRAAGGQQRHTERKQKRDQRSADRKAGPNGRTLGQIETVVGIKQQGTGTATGGAQAATGTGCLSIQSCCKPPPGQASEHGKLFQRHAQILRRLRA